MVLLTDHGLSLSPFSQVARIDERDRRAHLQDEDAGDVPRVRVLPDVTEDLASSDASELTGDRSRYVQQCPEHGQANLHVHRTETRVNIANQLVGGRAARGKM
jgi:hypothetical protein